MAKRLELLKDAMPNLTRAAVLVQPDNPLFKSTIPAVQAAANSLTIELQQFDARGVNEFEPAFLAMTRNRVEAVVLQEDAVFLGMRAMSLQFLRALLIGGTGIENRLLAGSPTEDGHELALSSSVFCRN